MPSLEIHPLSELRDEAARLLRERYARQRDAEPLLRETDGGARGATSFRSPAIEIRPGTPDDLEATAAFDEILWLLQARSPSFSGLHVPTRDDFREEWADLWDDPDLFTHFVAEQDG